MPEVLGDSSVVEYREDDDDADVVLLLNCEMGEKA